VGQDLFIPERGTYNEEAAKQVANAYWKAEEAAQEAARLQRIKAESETQEGRWYQSASSSPRQERTVQELRDYFNNMENSPGYQAVQYIRKNPGGSSFVKDMVDVIRPLNSGFGTVFTIAADYLGEKQAGLTGYNSVTHQFYGPDEQRDIRRSLALDAMLSAVPFGRLGVANGVVEANSGINPSLAARAAEYSAWKTDAGIVGKPTSAQFELFPSAVRAQNPGFAKYSAKEWPSNGGFREMYDDYFDVGFQFDRYGHGGGVYVSPLGESYRGRSLRPGSDRLPYSQYETVVPFPVKYGPAKGWFGYEGGASQARLPESVDSLLAKGWIRKKD
jgi:hypothetical protein